MYVSPQPISGLPAFNPFDLCIDKDGIYDEFFNPDSNHVDMKNVQISCEYYTEDQFKKSAKVQVPNSFSFFHLNIRSIPQHYDQLTDYLSILNFSFSVMAFSETWLHDNITCLYPLENYRAIHSCRMTTSGGGVSLYILDHFNFKERKELSQYFENTSVEAVFVEIPSFLPLDGESIIIGCIYRPPESDLAIFNDALYHTLEMICKERKKCVLLGDFNVNLLNSKQSATVDFLNALYSTYFYPSIHRPSRIASSSATLIDNILINFLNLEITSGLLLNDISDHLPVFQIIHVKDKTLRNNLVQEEIRYRKYSKRNVELFITSIKDVSWDIVLGLQEVEKAYQSFLMLFNPVFEKCFPMITIKKEKRKPKANPWFTTELRKHSLLKRKLYKKSILSPTPFNVQTYKECKNAFTQSLRYAKKKYFSDKFNQASSDIKSTWSVINQLLQRKTRQLTVPVEVLGNEGAPLNEREIANGLNDFFVNIGLSLAANINDSHAIPCSLIKGQFSPLCSFEPPTIAEVRGIVSNLKNSAEGHDGFKSSFIKDIIDFIIQPLTHIFGLSLKSGIVPRDLKTAKVLPLHKSGDSNLFNNYRPISILPCFSKILEKLIYSRISDHLLQNNILYCHQYGFRKKYSTEQALLQLVNNISSALEDEKYVLGVFLDLTKAFDTVNHKILVSKLKRYGLQDVALKWFSNYLEDREQFVCINGCYSTKLKISVGVPQGSILGPLLFLIYINDLTMNCNNFLPILFADDTNLIASHRDLNTLVNHVNNELLDVFKWFQLNKLTLNIKKCNFMIFSNKNKTFPKEKPRILINGSEICQVTHTKFLGVIIDDHLNWKQHIDTVCMKSMKMLGILRKVCPFVLPSSHLTLYYSLVFPHLNYCNIVWASTHSTYINK